MAEQINRAMDGWDSKPTSEERARITAEFIAKQRAWEQKLASLPPGERVRVAADDAAASEAKLGARKRGLVRAEAARLHVEQMEAEAERILARAEERLQGRIMPLMSGDEIDALRNEESSRAQAELREWVSAHPPPTLADDERAIRELLGEEPTDG
ncbi:MAG TPA: hypothetical protein VGM82_09770 [Gemmatimonadaceae bacterium]